MFHVCNNTETFKHMQLNIFYFKLNVNTMYLQNVCLPKSYRYKTRLSRVANSIAKETCFTIS